MLARQTESNYMAGATPDELDRDKPGKAEGRESYGILILDGSMEREMSIKAALSWNTNILHGTLTS